MTIQNDTAAVVEYIDTQSGGNLRKKNDLATLLELAAQQGNADVIARLAFDGTSLWNVFGILRKQTPQSEGYKQLEAEFASSLASFREGIASLMENADEGVLLRFHDIYLALGGGVIRNLTDLAHDFAKFKELQNTLRRGT
ncbi:MAG: hypothetical protein JNL32_14245 [Candidatus Kapabacteria bacterium]|nr:hypothetical protein [Candidatus Kapabacteria bacterium]